MYSHFFVNLYFRGRPEESEQKSCIVILRVLFGRTYLGMTRVCERVIGPEFLGVTGFLASRHEVL